MTLKQKILSRSFCFLFFSPQTRDKQQFVLPQHVICIAVKWPRLLFHKPSHQKCPPICREHVSGWPKHPGFSLDDKHGLTCNECFRCRNGFPVSFNLNLESIKLLPKSLFPLWPVTIKSWSQAPQLLSNTVKQEKPRLSLLTGGMSSALSCSPCWTTFSRQTLPFFLDSN